MNRLGSLLFIDGAALLVVIGGGTVAIRGHRLAVRDESPAGYGLRILGTMVAALGLAAAIFATTYRLSAG